jgi:hypothetical protein
VCDVLITKRRRVTCSSLVGGVCNALKIGWRCVRGVLNTPLVARGLGEGGATVMAPRCCHSDARVLHNTPTLSGPSPCASHAQAGLLHTILKRVLKSTR